MLHMQLKYIKLKPIGLKCPFTQKWKIRYHFLQESFNMIYVHCLSINMSKYLLPFILQILLFSYFSSSCFDWKSYVKHGSFSKETREVLNVVISLALYLLRFVHHRQNCLKTFLKINFICNKEQIWHFLVVLNFYLC